MYIYINTHINKDILYDQVCCEATKENTCSPITLHSQKGMCMYADNNI